MTKKEILKLVISTLKLRLRTIRGTAAHMIFRLALRFPTGCTLLAPVGDPRRPFGVAFFVP